MLGNRIIVKKRIELGGKNPDVIVKKLKLKYGNNKTNVEDGLRIDFPDHWVNFRKSNTEPILRCIVEAKSKKEAESLAEKYLNGIKNL